MPELTPKQAIKLIERLQADLIELNRLKRHFIKNEQAQADRIKEVSHAIVANYTRTQFEQLSTTEVRTAILPHLNTKQYARALRLIGVNPRHSTRLPDGSIVKCHKILPDSILMKTPNDWYTKGNITYTPSDV